MSANRSVPGVRGGEWRNGGWGEAHKPRVRSVVIVRTQKNLGVIPRQEGKGRSPQKTREHNSKTNASKFSLKNNVGESLL